MVTKVEFYKKSRFIFLSLIFSFLFISCFNSFTPNPEALSQPSERYVDISGRYSIDGALPKAIVESMYPDMQNDFSRSVDGAGTLYSAFPIIGTTNNIVEYYAFAKDADGVEQNVTGSVTVADKSFQIPHLKIGVSWIVEVGIKVKNTVAGTDTWIRCLYDISEPKTFTETDFTFNKTFLLKPDTSGTGFVDLDMNLGASFDSSIVRLECELDDDTQCDKWNSATTEEFNFSKIKMSGLPAGVYDITLYFYTSLDGGYPAYTTVQSINVISGMTTETWCSDGTSLITGTGTNTAFNLTSALINEYKKSVIYVGQTSAATSVGITAHNDNEGTAYSPLATLQEAINRIESNNSPKDYRIFVSGTVSGAPTGDANIDSGINGKALSITIDKTGNTSDAAPVINGSGNNSVLYIETEVPVKIRNVTITGGNTISSGGGISIIDSNTKVTLEGNVVITENHTSVSGGGIYNEGELIIKNATITENTSAGDGAGIYNAGELVIYDGEISLNTVNGSDTYKYGGGIYNSGSCKIKGGTITLNESHRHGGGIYNTGHLELSGGTISANQLPGGANPQVIGGAGIYSAGTTGTFDMSGGTITGHTAVGTYSGAVEIEGGTFTMTGGSISGNRSNGWTAGVYLAATSASFIMSGGSISDNVTMRTMDQVKGGAVYSIGTFKLSGTAYIPEGDNNGTTDNGYNDIYLSAGKKIIAAGNLSKHLETGASPLAITVTNWTRGNTVIEADGAGITDLSSYFNFVSSKTIDWYTELSGDKTKILLNSPIYVAGSTVHPTCGVAGSASGNGSRSAPFDSIANACSIMDNSSLDYKIYIDGTILAGQVIGSGFTGAAHSITITGANDLSDDGTPEDKIEGPNKIEGSTTYIGFTLNTTTAPVTLKKLLITKCELSSGSAAGVHVTSGTLSLGDDLVITGNKAGGNGAKGAGVFVNSGITFKVSGNVKIYGNTNYSTPTPCNVYLPNGRVINVTGPLNKKNDNGDIIDNANICVTSEYIPNLTNSYRFTSGYNTNNPGVIPGTYFHGDKWAVRAVASGTSAGEAELAANGGSITLEPIYQALTLNVTKSVYLTSDESKVITFTADNDLTIGSAEGNVSITSCVLTSHGESVPARSGDKTYYSTGTDTFTFGSDLPTGDYSIDVTASYNGRSYSVRFPVQYKDQLGSKAKTQGKDVGDIVFNDGSTMSYTEYDSLPETIKNELKPKAIAVIFYKGTGLNSGNDTTTVRTLGLGLKQSLKAWCTNSANAYNENITTIQCKKTSGSSGNLLFEDAEANDRNGSNNLEQIAAFLMRNELNPRNDTGVGINSSTTAEAAASLYPAFYFAKNYKNEKIGSETTSRIISGSEFETGWYLPTIAELFQLDKNGKYDSTRIFDINAVLSALGGESFGNTYLSSSQDCDGAGNANKLLYDGVYNTGKTDGSMHVCCIREF